MIRKIIEINEGKCNGCGLCIPNCPEGALQIIDGKARLISDLFCDGLGACMGNCPVDAISVVEREAEPYNEAKVMEIIVKQGENTVLAHLNHLKDHGEVSLLKEALLYLHNTNTGIPEEFKQKMHSNPHEMHASCPHVQHMSLDDKKNTDKSHQTNSGQFCNSSYHENDTTNDDQSYLSNWPIELKLINPMSPFFVNSDLLLAADCTAYSYPGFQKLMKNKKLIIACPKLDNAADQYIEKLAILLSSNQINTITLVTMEVPCCNGLLMIAQEAIKRSGISIPLKHLIVSIQGTVLKNEWIQSMVNTEYA